MPLFGKTRDYENHLDGKLPNELEQFAHSIRWPVDVSQNMNIGLYFKEKYQLGAKEEEHIGIDLQLPAETPVYAPEKSILIIYHQDERDILRADIMLYSEKTRIIYTLAHLEAVTVPEHIRNINVFNTRTDITVEEGEQIGTVTYWPYPHTLYCKELPEDVKAAYGDTYHHLHFDAQFCTKIIDGEGINPVSFNPLLILKMLK